MFFEIFHCHCGQIKQFLDYDVWTPQFRCGTDIIQNVIDFIQDLKQNAHTKFNKNNSTTNRHAIRNAISLTLPGKKQMWFRSICFPKVICSNDNRMWHVSTISHSPADGWDRLADSLELKFISLTLSSGVEIDVKIYRRGIIFLTFWNRFCSWVCNFWNVEFRIPLQTWFICCETCWFNGSVNYWMKFLTICDS